MTFVNDGRPTASPSSDLARLTVDVSRDTTASTVRLAGEVDVATAPQLVDLLAALRRDGHCQITVDMSGVEFIDAAGLRALVTAHHRLAAAGGHLTVSGSRPFVQRVIRIAGLAGVLGPALTGDPTSGTAAAASQ